MKKALLLLSLLYFVMPLKVKGQQNVIDILHFQKQMNTYFSNSFTSPLPEDALLNLKELPFFTIDTSLIVIANFKKTREPKPFTVELPDKKELIFQCFGTAQFNFRGNLYNLKIYQLINLITHEKFKDYLLLPFQDSTNGAESFSDGRFIELSIPKGNKIKIDFNKAFTPFYAFNKKFACPIFSSTNNMKIPIKAGMKHPL